MTRHPNRSIFLDPAGRRRSSHTTSHRQATAATSTTTAITPDVPRVVVQRISTEWTKMSRGAPQATHRNATAHALMLPNLSAMLPVAGPRPDMTAAWLPLDGSARALSDSDARHSTATIPAHLVTYREATNFAPEEHLARLGRSQARLSIVVSDRDAAELRIRSGSLSFTGLRLQVGETVRYERNYRVGSSCMCGSEWRYYLDILNISYGLYHREIFLDRPTYLRQELNSMY